MLVGYRKNYELVLKWNWVLDELIYFNPDHSLHYPQRLDNLYSSNDFESAFISFNNSAR